MTKTQKIFFVFLSLFSILNFKSQRIKDSVRIEIDYNKKVSVKSMSGFLHFTDIKALEDHIKTLQPKYWRIGIGWSYKSVDDVAYLRSFGITPILVISDLYGYPGKKNNKEWPHPLQNDRLKKIITSEYEKFKNTVIYDIWNEPFHQSGFGDFDKKEYYDIFKKGHDIIRSLPGGKEALITGPSYDHYDEKEIDDFLNFCNNNNVRVDILSWHEFRDAEYYKDFTKDLKIVKNIILPKYPKVGVKKIILNEIINQYSQFSPSEILQSLKMFETNDIDGACKGCWAESDGVFNCNNSINGLLDKNGKPRSAWWAYKIYSQSVKNVRVQGNTNYDQTAVFASYDSNRKYVIVNNNSGNKLVNVKIILKDSIKSSKNVNVEIYEIPNSGENALDQMIFKKKQKIAAAKNLIQINVAEIQPKTVCYLLISNK